MSANASKLLTLIPADLPASPFSSFFCFFPSPCYLDVNRQILLGRKGICLLPGAVQVLAEQGDSLPKPTMGSQLWDVLV